MNENELPVIIDYKQRLLTLAKTKRRLAMPPES